MIDLCRVIRNSVLKLELQTNSRKIARRRTQAFIGFNIFKMTLCRPEGRSMFLRLENSGFFVAKIGEFVFTRH